MGHFANVCRRKKVIGGIKHHGGQNRKFIATHVHGKPVNWLLDSGSEVSVMQQLELAKSIGATIVETKNKAMAVDGSDIHIVG